MTRTTLIRGGTVVTASDRFVADVCVTDEAITQMGLDLQGAFNSEIDATGCLVLPGGVDPHVHLDFPTLTTTTADDTTSGTAAAAKGGTTTIINFALQRGGEPLLAALERSLSLAEGKAVIDYGFHILRSLSNGPLPTDTLPHSGTAGPDHRFSKLRRSIAPSSSPSSPDPRPISST